MQESAELRPVEIKKVSFLKHVFFHLLWKQQNPQLFCPEKKDAQKISDNSLSLNYDNILELFEFALKLR